MNFRGQNDFMGQSCLFGSKLYFELLKLLFIAKKLIFESNQLFWIQNPSWKFLLQVNLFPLDLLPNRTANFKREMHKPQKQILLSPAVFSVQSLLECGRRLKWLKESYPIFSFFANWKHYQNG